MRPGLSTTAAGIEVDARLRTTNKRVFAVGDVAGKYQFTHIAGYHAGVVIRNILFRLPAKLNYDAVPWVTYTDPELANVGMSEAAAREVHGDAVRVVTASFEENDRARTERRTEGFVKAVVGPKGHILGAGYRGCSGRGADSALDFGYIPENEDRRHVAQVIVALSDTRGEANKRAAGCVLHARRCFRTAHPEGGAAAGKARLARTTRLAVSRVFC